MDIEFRRKGELLVAKIYWAPKPKKYQSSETDWRFGWKLRLNCSITPIGKGYGLGPPCPSPAKGRPNARGYETQTFAWIVVEDDNLEFVLTLPDCIDKFQNSQGWGCAAGAPIYLGAGIFHCQATLIVLPPNFQADLRSTDDGLDLIETNLGVTKVIGHLTNCSKGKLLAHILGQPNASPES
jgi:hypothetical protein